MDSYFTDEQTLTLLQLVHTNEMQNKFNSNKKKHRKVWEEIAQILELQGIKKSAAKCQNRYENTKRSYNTIKRNHLSSEKPNYAYWDFWESILGEKKEMPWEGFEEFHETYLNLKQSFQPSDPIPDWVHWEKYETYYKEKGEMIAKDDNRVDNPKNNTQPIFTDRETDELLLIMGEPETRKIFIKHRKKHRIAWNYILKRLKKKGIHKTIDKVKNRFENLKRKYMQYKKNVRHTNDLPVWRYWNVFEEYMASRPNPADSDFMTDESQAKMDVDCDDATMIVDGINCEETVPEETTTNKLDMLKVKHDSQLSDGPIDVLINKDNHNKHQICRICLQSDHQMTSESMMSLFSPLNSNIHINEALAICVGLEIFDRQDSSLADQICVSCINQLRATYNFRKLCWTSEYELKSNMRSVRLCEKKYDLGTAIEARVLRPRSTIKTINQELIEDGNKFRCKDCLLIFESESSHRQHENICERKSLPPQPSIIPSFTTKYEFVDTNVSENHNFSHDCSLKEMVPTANDLLEFINFSEDGTNPKECAPDKLSNFKCSICMKKFPNIEYIKKHLVKIHSLKSDSQTFKNYLELSNCDSDDELDDNVKCYICGKSYVKREYLKKHLKLIHNITDADYNVYERIDEENKTKKPLLCHSCGESFVLKHIFKKHIEHHERGGLLSCDYCDIKLVDKTALQRHMILHTGQRNHKCIFCAKGFFTRISQKRHERNVHTKEKSHICQYCDKKFVMWKFLERHLNTHTAEVVYECDQCDKKYLNKNHLRVHKFRHAKEPPFKCTACAKAYFDRSSLKKHNYVHTGNPYSCSRCDRTFDRRDKMNNHLQKVHGLSKLISPQVGVNQNLK